MAFSNSISFKIDSDQIDATLANFPLRLYLTGATGPDNLDFSDVFTALGDSDRKKISVMSGATECYVEIVYWDATSEKAVLDIRVPSVSDSADTELTLYYDSAEAENTTHVGDTGSTPAQTVWDSDFLAVYHLGDTGASAVDATANGDDGTFGGTVSQIDGPIAGKANYFNSGYFSLSSSGFLASTGTFECIVRLLSAKNYTWLFCEQGTANNNNEIEIYGQSDGDLMSVLWAGTTAQSTLPTISLTADGSWHTIAFGWDSSEAVTFKDGSQIGSRISPSLPSVAAGTQYVGTRPGADHTTVAYMADVRLSKIRRSDAWLIATNAGLNDEIVKAPTGTATDDLATSLSLVAEDVVDLAIAVRLNGFALDDMALGMRLSSWQVDDLSAQLSLSYGDLTDLRTDLRLSDGTSLASLATLIRLTDGTSLASLATRMAIVRKAPAFTAVIAQRLRSTLEEVS